MKAMVLNSLLIKLSILLIITGNLATDANSQSVRSIPSGKSAIVCHRGANRLAPENTYASAKKAIESGTTYVEVDVRRSKDGVYIDYKLIAHRGGITGGKYNEYDPASIQAAIDKGYYMLEVDVRESKDSILVLNHDDNFSRFYNDRRRVNELTWNEIMKLRPINGNYHPVSFEELAQLCSGKIKLMIDVKEVNPTLEFYLRLEEIMEKYNLFPGSYFLGKDARKYFWGKAKFSIRAEEIELLKEKVSKGEDVACNYFLFDAGNRLNSSIIKMCQMAHITVVPSVNFGHYQFENPLRGAKRDIEFLKECGVTEFQIDSDFDSWLPNMD
jgi:glycerophosphoryl diester phosphodiesterase